MCNVNALRTGLQVLLDRKIFVLWKMTERDGEWTKTPHQTNGYGASSTDATTWTDFETAAAVYEMSGGAYDGIGIMIPDDGSLAFVDCDGALQPDNTWQSYVNDFYGLFSGAFFEVSQSGRGCHFIMYGKKPDEFGSKSKDKNVANFDIYTRARFCALTGTQVRPMQVLDYSAQLAQVCETYIGRPIKTDNVQFEDVTPEDYMFKGTDEELVAIALKSHSTRAVFGGSASFKDLWNRNEDVLAKHYPGDTGPVDESKVESALATHLSFYTGANPARIERIMMAWPHVREKFTERQDYRHGTILKAVSLTTDYYSKRDERVTEFASQFVTPPATLAIGELPAWTRGVTPGGNYSKDHTPSAIEFLRTYYDNGRLLKRISQDFYRYNGKVWEQVDRDTLTHELMTAMLTAEPQDSWVKGTMNVISSMIHGGNDAMFNTWGDRSTNNVIVYQNGILDLSTNEFVPHTPDFFTTNIMPYEYDPASTCTRWEQFLWESFEGDQQRVDLLQEWLGYCLVRDYTYAKALLLIGVPGSGKSTIGRILHALVGDVNFSATGLEDLADDETINGLRNKTVAFDGDAHTVSRQNQGTVTTRFKKITGNDAISFKRKYLSSLSAVLPTRITVAANNMLSFFDDSGAMAARFMPLPLNVSFRDTNRADPYLGEKLLSEISGIANWAIVGLRRLKANDKFTIPDVSREEMEMIAESYSPLSRFAEDYLEFGQEHSVTGEALFNAYKLWARTQGNTSVGTQQSLTRNIKNTFRERRLKHTNVVDAAGNRKKGFFGVRIKSTTGQMAAV